MPKKEKRWTQGTAHQRNGPRGTAAKSRDSTPILQIRGQEQLWLGGGFEGKASENRYQFKGGYGDTLRKKNARGTTGKRREQ